MYSINLYLIVKLLIKIMCNLFFIFTLSHVKKKSLGTTVSSTNKTDIHNITEILLKAVLNTLTLPLKKSIVCQSLTNLMTHGQSRIQLATLVGDEMYR
jgi:hypothetical protein